MALIGEDGHTDSSGGGHPTPSTELHHAEVSFDADADTGLVRSEHLDQERVIVTFTPTRVVAQR